jgi:hypothetical protein
MSFGVYEETVVSDSTLVLRLRYASARSMGRTRRESVRHFAAGSGEVRSRDALKWFASYAPEEAYTRGGNIPLSLLHIIGCSSYAAGQEASDTAARRYRGFSACDIPQV